MKSYAAHAVLVIEFKEGDQDEYPVWENVYLISAGTPEQAFERAQERAKEDEGDSHGTFTWDGRPATFRFVGIRKLLECDAGQVAGESGVEITFLQLGTRRGGTRRGTSHLIDAFWNAKGDIPPY